VDGRYHPETLRGFGSNVTSTGLISPSLRREPSTRVRPGASLFPVATRSGLPPWMLVLGYLSGIAAISATALLRQPGLAATRTIWAEDGRIFYAQSTTMSFWRTLTTLHNGYMQLFPRVAVQLARLVPVANVSVLLAITGALSLGCLACLVFHMAKGQIASPGLRALLAAGMVLLPVANVELLNNVVNVPWWFFFATFWALLWRPRSWMGRTGAALLCFVAAASEALVALFLPLAVARLVALPQRKEQAATAGLFLGLLYQAVVILPSGSKALSSPGGLHDIGQSFAVRVGLGMVGGVKGTDWLVVQARGASIALGLVVFGSVLVAGLWTRSTRVRMFTVVAAAYSALCFVIPVWLRDVATVMQLGTVRLAGRYQAVPVLLLTSAMLVLADHFVRQSSVKTWRHSKWETQSPHALPRSVVPARSVAAVTVCAAVLIPSWVADFRGPNQRSSGPEWATEVAQATALCRRGATALATLAIDPPYWTVSLPCRVLTGPG
jgi:hypothetical protein